MEKIPIVVEKQTFNLGKEILEIVLNQDESENPTFKRDDKKKKRLFTVLSQFQPSDMVEEFHWKFLKADGQVTQSPTNSLFHRPYTKKGLRERKPEMVYNIGHEFTILYIWFVRDVLKKLLELNPSTSIYSYQ